jgi:hypothetical protein
MPAMESPMINENPPIMESQKIEFWSVVRDCLVGIHRMSASDAEQKSKDLRRRIELPPPDISSEIFYHAEPFDVACDIAETYLDLQSYRDPYDQILARHNW